MVYWCTKYGLQHAINSFALRRSWGGHENAKMIFAELNCHVLYHQMKEKSPENLFFQRAITQLKVGKTRQKFKLTDITSRQIHILSTKFNLSQHLKGRLREVENRVDGYRVDRRTDRLSEQRQGYLKSSGFTGRGLSALHPLKNRFMYIYCLCCQGEQGTRLFPCHFCPNFNCP